MTDREAIRRLAQAAVLAHTGNRAEAGLALAKILADLDGPEQGCAFALCADCELHIQPEWCRCQAEPAAPTDPPPGWGLTHVRCCRCGGYYIPKTGHECPAPTVTREQAIRIRTICEMELKRMDIDIPDVDEMPAFFRAVADALEGK